MAANTAPSAGRLDPLPKDLVEMQLNQIDLLLAMYASPEEISAAELARVDALRAAWRAWCDDDGAVPRPAQPSIGVRLSLPVAPPGEEEEEEQKKQMELDVVVPMMRTTGEGASADDDDDEPPPVAVKLLQPPWLSKSELAAVRRRVPPGEDTATTIELAKDAASAFLAERKQQQQQQQRQAGGSSGGDDRTITVSSDDAASSLVRVWFYFPSISTRAKRDDLVRAAPAYGLTGFLLAGKPGLLCVEGAGAAAVDAYMRYVKTDSWGDIPAHQKKVSERWREHPPRRAFADMTEITDALGDRRGERANRGDMKALEAWLAARGLGDAMTRVLI